jgi:excinuclease ABC subunit C
VKDLTTPEIYAEAVRDVKLFLEGRQTDLVKSLRERMSEAAEAQEFERAARYRDLISTVEQLQEKQRIAAAEGDDADVFGYHYENQMLAVNLFHMRGGKVLDRREFFWEDLPELPRNQPDTSMEGEEASPSPPVTPPTNSIPANSSPPCSSSSIWRSPTSRATSTSRRLRRPRRT